MKQAIISLGTEAMRKKAPSFVSEISLRISAAMGRSLDRRMECA